MKKKTIANLVMVLIIAGIILTGVFTAGHIRGWFDKPSDEKVLLTEFRGIITMEREGIAYTTTEDTVLREGDVITCSPKATVKITVGDGYVTLGQSGTVKILNANTKEFAIEVISGEVFVNTQNPVLLSFDGKSVEIKETVAILSVRKGAQSISVYYGTVEQAQAGEVLEWINNELSVRTLSIKSLNDFNIAQIRKANIEKQLVFTNADLDVLEAERWEQMYGGEVTEPDKELVADKDDTAGNDDSNSDNTGNPNDSTNPGDTTEPGGTTESGGTIESGDTTDPDEGNSQDGTTTDKDEVADSEGNTENKNESDTGNQDSATKLTCTITIRCDTILDNWDDLDPEKGAYVPENGCILPVVTVEFTEGETVFHVLERVCKKYNIQIEYSWTPMYGSYYIEGINYLYEFDCGSESGWMYKVNGWFPNYGCSSYYLTGGETIVWCYTCKGLGKDVGADGW